MKIAHTVCRPAGYARPCRGVNDGRQAVSHVGPVVHSLFRYYYRAAMHPDTREVAKHMREFGLAILGRAVYDLTFSEMMAPFKHSMAVGLAAQGAAICIKARIAQEHPLLLFNQLPKSTNAEDQLTVGELFEYGRTIQYQELPELLWATTGVRIRESSSTSASDSRRRMTFTATRCASSSR